MRRFTTVGLCFACLVLLGAVGVSSAAAAPAVDAWGSNAAGQLGDGTTENSLTAAPVSGLSKVVQVSAGGEFSLALLENGTVEAWGANNAGQLGNGTTTASSVPVPVSGLSNVVAVSAGSEFALALLGNGTVMAWGYNKDGELGNRELNNSDVPVEVFGLGEVTAISAGGKHSLALLTDHRVSAWGADVSGQLGNGETGNGQDKPVEVKELGGVTAIAAGGAFSLALLENGTVESWGSNGSGQLGNGTNTPSDTAVAVKGLLGVKSIAAGQTHGLALLNGGEVWAWGSGGSGELGNGLGKSSTEPVQASSLTEVSAIAAGSKYSVALLSNGTVSTWGVNKQGQLGDGNKASSTTPVANTDIVGVTAISAGAAHVLVQGPLLPKVTAVAPGKGPAGGGTAVTITGTNFVAVSAVRFGATAALVYTVESETTIHAVSPAGVGIVNVTVTIPGGSSPGSAANTFTYAPLVTRVSPAGGPQQGGTMVIIEGSNFEGASAVNFGKHLATGVKVESPTEITALSPVGAGVVDVTVTGPGGTSATTPADEFTYTNSPPEIGRCVKVASKSGPPTGQFNDGACTKGAPEGGKFEWEPGPGTKSGFRIKVPKGEKIRFETVGNKEVECKNAKGSGVYSSSRTLSNLVLTFTGCANGVGQCKTPGIENAGEGRVQTESLDGRLGIITTGPEPTEDLVGFQIGAESKETFVEFECPAGTGGTLLYVWQGAAILPFRTTDKMLRKEQLKYLEDKGHQNVESFEGEPKSVLSASISGGAFEQGAILLTVELSNKEKTEINLLH